jgi:hypothetical protein
MHTHSEIVIPPTTDIEAAVAQIMRPFDENLDRDDEHRLPSFWDFYVIGGRFAGHKLLASYDKAKIDAFYEWLTAEKVTVSSLQAGKQKLSPESQEAKVDAKWNEMFPSEHPIKCPVFAHSNDQYSKGMDGVLPDDVMLLMDVPASLTMSRIIFAEHSYKNDGTIEPEFMLIDDAWNGCNYMKTAWDGTFGTALSQYREKFKHMSDEAKARKMPQDNWLVVTVDSHS